MRQTDRLFHLHPLQTVRDRLEGNDHHRGIFAGVQCEDVSEELVVSLAHCEVDGLLHVFEQVEPNLFADIAYLHVLEHALA